MLEQRASIRVRLALFILQVALLFIVFIIMLLLAAGVFDFTKSKLQSSLNAQMLFHKSSLSKHFDILNIRGKQLSNDLEQSIQNWLENEAIDIRTLNGDAPKIENLLQSLAPELLHHFPDGNASGVFLMLNTSNQAAAEDDRAGLLMRNLEPNSINKAIPNIWMMFGPANISKALNIRILPQWRMEFPSKFLSLYNAFALDWESKESLKDSYYLSPAISSGTTPDKGFYLSFPLKDKEGELLGICGYEVNAMLFKLLYSTPSTEYPSSIFMMTTGTNEELYACEGLISTQTPFFSTTQNNDCLLSTDKSSEKLNVFHASSGENLIGFTEELAIYPSNSPFYKDRWYFAVLYPDEEFRFEESRERMRVLMWGLIAFALNFVLLLVFSTFFMGPIYRAITQIVEGGDNEVIKPTGILEIDDLLEFLKQKEEVSAQTKLTDEKNKLTKKEAAVRSISPEQAFAFKERISALSPAERAVFDLYIEGHTAKEITELLHLSINTIKTHNKRIYMKLDVGSRLELLDYVYYLEDRGELS